MKGSEDEARRNLTMTIASERLYEEFLDNYNLNRALYNHAVEMSEPIFVEDKIRAFNFKKMQVAVTKATKNSTTFNTKLHASQIAAEKEVKRIIRGYRTYRMEEDDVEMLCPRIEEEVLRNLLYPFHLLTVESELEKDQFYPIAHEMEKIVQQVLGIIYNFYESFYQGQNRIQQRKRDEIELKNRQTDAWAANAPVHIRGRIREGMDGRLHFYGTARSTVTEGMVAADYQVNQLLANQNANRESLENQKVLLEYLEKSLLEVINNYVDIWYKCLENMGGGNVGNKIIGISVYKATSNFRPHIEANMRTIFTALTKDDNFANIEYMVRYYDYDFDDLLGDKVAKDMYNSYVRTKKIDESNFLNSFYCYFYDVEHAIEYEPFFNRFRELLKAQARKHCEKIYQSKREEYTDVYCDRILAPFYRLFDAIPGLDDKHRRYLSNTCHYEFYDVMGNADFRDIYDKKKDDLVFDYDWDKK